MKVPYLKFGKSFDKSLQHEVFITTIFSVDKDVGREAITCGEHLHPLSKQEEKYFKIKNRFVISNLTSFQENNKAILLEIPKNMRKQNYFVFTSIKIQLMPSNGYHLNSEIQETFYFKQIQVHIGGEVFNAYFYQNIVFILGFFSLVFVFLYQYIMGDSFEPNRTFSFREKIREILDMNIDAVKILESEISNEIYEQQLKS